MFLTSSGNLLPKLNNMHLRIPLFLTRIFRPTTQPVDYTLPLEEIRKFDSTTLELILPTVISEFNASPFMCSSMIYTKLEAMLDRYRELNRMDYTLNGNDHHLKWPTQEGLQKLARLKEGHP